jgi:hypothetical protein
MMWLILFALAVAAGILFSLAAMMLQQRPWIHRTRRGPVGGPKGVSIPRQSRGL